MLVTKLKFLNLLSLQIPDTGDFTMIPSLENHLRPHGDDQPGLSLYNITLTRKKLTCAIMERMPRTAINAATLSGENFII